MGKRKTSIPFGTMEKGSPPADRVRKIDPESEEGREIFEQLMADLPEGFGKPGKKHYYTPHIHDSSRNKQKVVEAWKEKKTLNEWIKDPRCICKSKRALRGRLRVGWTPEKAMSTPYDGIYLV